MRLIVTWIIAREEPNSMVIEIDFNSATMLDVAAAWNRFF